MEIIEDLECSPRRIYTGSIGFVEPGGRAQFNVAIRTVIFDKTTGSAEFGVGGGIVADSSSDQEWEEGRVKARVLTTLPPSFDLLETMLWKPDVGYLLLARHMKRLRQSAEYFGYALDLIDAGRRLELFASDLSGPQRVRMLVSRLGDVSLYCDAARHRWGLSAAGARHFAHRFGQPFSLPQDDESTSL